MSKTSLVRPSRDGDQFHYLWAARRCLRLLSSESGLVALSIEGSSVKETETGPAVESGEELIDVAEYYGSEDIDEATTVRYIQLKHSTRHGGEAWPPSGLKGTLEGFAERFRALVKRDAKAVGKLEFWFVSNRPIAADFVQAIGEVAANRAAQDSPHVKTLERYTKLKGEALATFCKLLHLEGEQSPYWDQRNLLALDANKYLPNADVDAPIRLKELVTRKALSESESNPQITKFDVLRALETDIDQLFPAPLLIKPADHFVPREQEPSLIAEIINAADRPVIVHAEGGVGKSIFATRIGLGLPEGSVCVVYDCFGNGQYRSASGYRHRHRDALVQIANELASRGLCHPLIPSATADHKDYMRAFLHRLTQAAGCLKADHPEAVLCIAIDAADNAQIAAEEIGEARSFARDLVREAIPPGVRFVFLCRSHRIGLLDPAPAALPVELLPFSRAETARYLRETFPDATEHDVDEFHRLSSQNPRVEATALARKAPLPDILRALGPNPTTVEDTIASLLAAAVADLRDKAGPTEKGAIDLICAGLAALRPLIPISVLAAVAKVEQAAVRSFALDLGRPLIIIGDTVQFFDEPAETWFREQFKPKAEDLANFVAVLRPLASNSAYVAAALPQLMLEAGQFSELVTLALSSEALPAASPLEKRDIELQRLQFALKASLRMKRYRDAAKLALKAGGETAGDSRQQKLIQGNTDLAALFMDADRLRELISRRTFGGSWKGAHHAYEAALLSGQPELLGEARSRLRMAHEWLRNWSRLPDEERQDEPVSEEDIAALAMAHLNIHGGAQAARWLTSWRPPQVPFRAGRLLAKRLIDHARYEALDEIAVAAGNNLCLVLALAAELDEVHRHLPEAVVKRTVRLLRSRRVDLRERSGYGERDELLHAVNALIASAHKMSAEPAAGLATVLARYLPEPPAAFGSRFEGSRFEIMRGFALHAALAGRTLQLEELAHKQLRKELEVKDRHTDTRELQEFRETIGALLPWHRLWAQMVVGRDPISDLARAVSEVRSASGRAENIYHREESYIANEVARLWLNIAIEGAGGDANIAALNEWIGTLRQPLFAATLAQLARVCARTPSMKASAFDFARVGFDLVKDERADAEIKVDGFTALARAVVSLSKSEAEAYFDQAVEVADKIGDENLDRWGAVLDLADRAATRKTPSPELAYRLARCAELTYAYVDRDKHFAWEATVEAIAGLCPSSALAVLSRWRDRGFGWAERLLPAAVEYLLGTGAIDPKAAVTLIGCRARWDEVKLLRAALGACASKDEQQAVVGFAYHYLRLDHRGTKVLRSLQEVLSSHAFAPLAADLEKVIRVNERVDRSRGEIERNNGGVDLDDPVERKSPTDWDTVFAGIDLARSDDLLAAFRRFKDHDPPWYHENFFQAACDRVSVGSEAAFLKAFAEVPEFELYQLRSLLTVIPAGWRKRLAIKSAIAELVKTYCRRYCLEITRSRYYEVLPFATACELSGADEAELVEVVLQAIGDFPEVVGAGRLFTLVGLLTRKLSGDDALEALRFGLELFEPALEPTDGDGPWTPALVPTPDVNGALAGYVWACLASPRGYVRWEAAHIVRGLFALDRKAVLDSLVALATKRIAGPFADPSLHFYAWHARQWLLIAMARAAQESPGAVAPYADFLRTVALESEPHVLMRGFAATALLALGDGGHVALDEDTRRRLHDINKSPFPPRPRNGSRYAGAAQEAAGGDGDDRFLFGIDIGPYWFTPLGRVFGKTEKEIERAATRLLRDEWDFKGSGRWDEDQRQCRRIFKDRETWHSHGSYPRTDDLIFYLAYHAMMTIAGRLLATTPVYEGYEDSGDEFEEWLRSDSLTRADGKWLFDRRDPEPLDLLGRGTETSETDWPWSVSASDFETALGLGRDRLNLWGGWATISGRRLETVRIRSALVSPGRSDALLRALQTISNSHDYLIPDADDDKEIDNGPFQLKGWIAERSGDQRLDRLDPWAGDISYPPITPAGFVGESWPLTADLERRYWSVAGQPESGMLWSEMWGYHVEDEDREERRPYGRRLQASWPFVRRFLAEKRMDFIIEIELDRKLHRSSYESRRTDEFEYLQSNARLFIIGSDGRVRSL